MLLSPPDRSPPPPPPGPRPLVLSGGSRGLRLPRAASSLPPPPSTGQKVSPTPARPLPCPTVICAAPRKTERNLRSFEFSRPACSQRRKLEEEKEDLKEETALHVAEQSRGE